MSESNMNAPFDLLNVRRWGFAKGPRVAITNDDERLRAMSRGLKGGSPKSGTPAYDRLLRSVVNYGRSA
jgi:hypothetical protein